MKGKDILLPMKSGYYKRSITLQYRVATHTIVTNKIFILKKYMKIKSFYKFSI